MVPRVVVLLRGVNVGGRNLPMAGLREMLIDAGCSDVVTYIQSGNVVLSTPDDAGSEMARWLEQKIGAHAGFDVPVVLRTADDVASLIDRNPYPGAEGSRLHVTFFADEPSATVLDAVAADEFGADEFTLAGRDIYMHLPDGMGRAKLPIAIERALKRHRPPLVGTTRNWNTVVKLQELASS